MDPNRLPFIKPHSVGAQTAVGEDIRQIAIWQRKFIAYLLAALVGQVALIGLLFVVATQVSVPLPTVTWFVVLSLLLLSVPVLIAAFRLSSMVFDTAVAWLFVLLCFLPFLGLIALMIANSKATRILRENGIKVGFLGVNFLQLPLATSNKAQK